MPSRNGHPANSRLRRKLISVAPNAVVVAEHADLTAGRTEAEIDDDLMLTYHEWVHTGRKVRRDGIGRLRENSYGHQWLVVECNNPYCGARVDIREDILCTFANSALRDYTAHWYQH